MVKIDVAQLITNFSSLAERWLEGGDLRVALDLDDLSMRLMSASGHLLQAPELAGQLHDFRKTVRRGEREQARLLLVAMEPLLRRFVEEAV